MKGRNSYVNTVDDYKKWREEIVMLILLTTIRNEGKK
jgi:hypothetical protein